MRRRICPKWGDRVPRNLPDIARAYAALLLLDTSQWIHRRVERAKYTNANIIKWQFSVDFTVPRDLQPFEDLGDGEFVYFLPIALLRKWPPLKNFDLRDESGQPVPLLTSDKNREVDAAALEGLMPADYRLSGWSEVLRKVVWEGGPTSKDQLESVSRDLKRIGEQALGGDGKWDTEQEVSLGMTHAEYLAWYRAVDLATSLASNSILWARVRARPGQRQVLKACFESSMKKQLRLRDRILIALGWKGTELDLELPNLGERASFHLEFEPPAGTDVIDARLGLRDPFRKEREPSYPLREPKATISRTHWMPEDPGPPEPGAAWSYNMIDAAHFYVRGSEGQAGNAYITMAPSRRGFLSGSFYAAFLTTALLVAISWANLGVAPTSSSELEATVTVLVVLPALLSFLFAPPSPHPVARSMMVGVRFIVRAIVVLPVIAALILISGSSMSHCLIWLITAVSSVATALILVSAKIVPRCHPGERLDPPLSD